MNAEDMRSVKTPLKAHYETLNAVATALGIEFAERLRNRGVESH